MKKLVTSYTFDASAKTVTSADFTSLEIIQLITNVTDNIIIYNFADPAKGATLASTTLTLDYDTTFMDDADKLQIFVDAGTTQPVSGTVTANSGSNLNTSALALESGGNLSSIKTNTDKIPSQGQALAAASTPVVLPAAQITTLTPPAAITGFATETTLGGILTTSDFDSKTGSLTETAPASDTASSGLNGRLQRIAQRLTSLITAIGSPFQAGGSIGNTAFGATQSGTWTVQPGNTANTTAWKVDGSAVTQPVSAAALPLPALASTAALQTTGNTSLGSIDTSNTAINTVMGAKADAKNTATDTTSISIMSVLKQVSASIQAAAASLAGSLTVATHAVTQSGTWTVQPGNTANTTAWKVDGSAVTQPVSAASLPLPALAATSTKQSDGSQKTQVVDGSGNVIGATSNALDVNIKSGASSGTQYTEDAAATADPVGNMLIGRRKDTLSTTEVSADGDNIALNATNKGQLHVKLADTVTVDGSGVTQPVSLSSVPSHAVTNAGTFAVQNNAATPAGTNNIGDVDVLTVNGVAPAFGTGVRGATVQRVTIATDDSVPVTAASLPLPALAATSTKQSDGSQKSQIVDGSGNVIGATSNALDVNIKSGASSGTQYTEADTDASITGTAVMWEDGSDTLRAVSAAKPLPVSLATTIAGEDLTNDLLKIGGNVAHDAVDAGNPTKLGGYAKAAAPTDVSADGDRVNAWFLKNGAQTVNLTAAGALIPGDATNGLDVDVTRINGVAPAFGTGTRSASVQRVTIATDDSVPVTITSVPSHAVTNAGTFAVQESGTQVQVDDAAFTPATSKIVMAGFEADETSTDSVDEGDGGAARMTLDRKQIVALYAHAAGGYTPGKLVSAGSTNATSVVGAACTLGYITASNVNAAARYLKIYNKATSPTVGTDTPVAVFLIPGNTAGAGTNIPLPPQGMALSLGFAFALTTGATDADTGAVAANEIIVNYGTK